MDKSVKKEIILYSIIAVILIVLSALNNIFWKIGKEEKKETIKEQEVQQLESNNITYDVPYNEKWLD